MNNHKASEKQTKSNGSDQFGNKKNSNYLAMISLGKYERKRKTQTEVRLVDYSVNPLFQSPHIVDTVITAKQSYEICIILFVYIYAQCTHKQYGLK